MVLNSDNVNCLLELILRNAPIFSYTRRARGGGVYMTIDSNCDEDENHAGLHTELGG